ncbi:hypothetical protein [Serratia nevei]|uniref:hypothetical protein n=1 Tax=Serratia nevei TaxID=2703794 RepID=UPI001A25D460|nr:hypothetical protein [Serratia marcescens]HAT4512317.1 hypothetical protein [Serratia marcescens]HAT4538939.1 hypothetical protein [Serratia marcescens]
MSVKKKDSGVQQQIDKSRNAFSKKVPSTSVEDGETPQVFFDSNVPVPRGKVVTEGYGNNWTSKKK